MADLYTLDPLRQRLVLAEELQRRVKFTKIESYYPETGPLRRGLYKKNLEFFKAGKKYRQRLVLAGNRTGKTEGIGCYELTLHLTGNYPEWWEGRRFDRAVSAWAAGDTGKTVRDIIQFKLLGAVGEFGTGLIPGDLIIGRPTSKPGVADAVETVRVKHVSGGVSYVTLKSYDQRRVAFQGTEQDIILLDEEPPADVKEECLLRTMTTGGMLMLTFTPLQGLTPVVLQFMPGGRAPAEGAQKGSRYLIMITWDDVPHLTKEQKDELLADVMPYQREARSKGIPALGSGAIYPIAEDDIICDDFPIPEHWRRAYGMDVGWNATAASWGAYNQDDDTWYLYAGYKRGLAEPDVHTGAIKSRGAWIPGVIDPAARGRNQKDGTALLTEYEDLGLKLTPADNSVEAGLLAVYRRMTTGKLKVFKSMRGWLDEFRIYRRDEKGRIVKENDHYMDVTRYLMMSGLDVAKVQMPKRSWRERLKLKKPKNAMNG